MFLVKLGQYFALSRNHKEVVEMVQFLRMRAAFLQPLLLLLLPIVLKKKDIATNIVTKNQPVLGVLTAIQ